MPLLLQTGSSCHLSYIKFLGRVMTFSPSSTFFRHWPFVPSPVSLFRFVFELRLILFQLPPALDKLPEFCFFVNCLLFILSRLTHSRICRCLTRTRFNARCRAIYSAFVKIHFLIPLIARWWLTNQKCSCCRQEKLGAKKKFYCEEVLLINCSAFILQKHMLAASTRFK